MSKTFGTMKTNVGNNVQDTSAAMATIIGVYLNNRYQELVRRINWQVVNPDYYIDTVSGTQDYELPSDFGKEIYCVDSTNEIPLTRRTLQEIAGDHTSGLTDQDTPSEYAIFDKWICGSRSKVLRLYKIPNSIYNISLPYIYAAVAMVSSTAVPMLSCEDVLELGATADAWRYKRQFAKAGDFELLFEKGVINLIWEMENQPNQVHLFNPLTYPRDTV